MFGTRLRGASREKLLTVGRVAVAGRGSLYSASSGEPSGPWSNLMPWLSVQDPGAGPPMSKSDPTRRPLVAPALNGPTCQSLPSALDRSSGPTDSTDASPIRPG